MKYSILFILFCLFAAHAQGQQIANSNFENWTDNHYAEGWNTFELGVFPLVFYSASRATDAAYGDYAVELETRNIVGEQVPGVIMLGDINMDTYMPMGGVPFTDRPTGLSFSYKYSPVGNDALLIVALLTKWNEDTQETDTIGAGIFQSYDLQTSYLRETVPIYYQSEEAPDTINIGFSSSSETPQDGSILYVDSIALDYEIVNYPTTCFPAINITHSSFTALWGPIPYSVGYQLEVAYDASFTSYVTDFPMLIANDGSNYSYNVSGLEIGQYFYRVKIIYEDEPGEYSNVISVPLPTLALNDDNSESNSFTANWEEAIDARGYILDVATDVGFDEMLDGYSQLSVGTTTSYNIEGLDAGIVCYYRLKTIYDTDTSIVSNVEDYDNIQFNITSYKKEIKVIVKDYSNTVEIEIYDAIGRKLLHQNYFSNEIMIEMPHTGIYIVKISDGNFNATKKVILY